MSSDCGVGLVVDLDLREQGMDNPDDLALLEKREHEECDTMDCV